MSFKGKVALVAGAGGGMGLQIARDLIHEGAHVSLVDIKEAPDFPATPGSGTYHRAT